MTDKFILIIILCSVFFLIGTTHSGEGATVTVTAEEYLCDKFDNNKQKCVKRSTPPEGAFTISINTQASTCSTMYEHYLDKKSVTFNTSQSLVYIDVDNWECRNNPFPPKTVGDIKFGNFQYIYTMSKGTLKIRFVDLDNIVSPLEFDLEQKTSVENWIHRLF
jgi:hypothetical protein